MKIFSAASLWLILACAIFTSWVHARWPTTVPEAAIFVLFGVWCVAGLTGKFDLRFSRALIPLGLILLLGAVQIATGITVYQWRTKVAILYWACNLATFFVALQVMSSRRTRSGFLQMLVILGLLLSLIGLIQEAYGGGKVLFLFDPDPRFIPQFGPFPYRNQYAALMELLLPVALYRGLTNAHQRMLYVVCAAIMYASVIAAGSRMGFFLATFEMLLVPAILYFSGRLRIRLLGNNALLFAAMFVMLIVAGGPAEMLTKFETPDPYAGRREFSEASLKMIQARPLTGFGIGAWSTAYPGYALFDNGLTVNQAHDDWVQWAAEGGMPLLAIMLGLAIWTIPRAFKSVWGLGVVSVFVHSFVDYPFQRTSVALLMFMMLAALASYEPGEERD